MSDQFLAPIDHLARLAAGDVRRVEFTLTDHELMTLPPIALQERRAELEGITAIAVSLGLAVSSRRDPVRMCEVIAISREE
jgi:hypothetical protein